MSTQLNAIEAEALKPLTEERVALADHLLASVETGAEVDEA